MDKTIKVWDAWDARTGQNLHTFTGTEHIMGVNSVAFSPDGWRIVSGSYDNTVKVWAMDTGRELQSLSRHREEVLSVAFSPNGRRIVSGSDDETLLVWDVPYYYPGYIIIGPDGEE
jgi:WD40 repeat protein